MDLTLRIYPDPILRKTTAPITEFDDALREFADAMVDAMYEERGIGLAAPQMGVGKRLIVVLQMETSDDDKAEPLVLVNPRVVATGGELWSFEEGCLSIPGITAPVLRSRSVTVEYQDVDGEKHKLTTTAMLGRILLHEIDHLDGRLFIDYLSDAQKSLVKSQLKKLTEDA